LEELKISEIGRIQKFREREREIKREMRDKRERQR